MSTEKRNVVDNEKKENPEKEDPLRMWYYKSILDLCFNNLAPFIIRRTPEATPAARTQIPMTRLDTADERIALYSFSFIETNLLKIDECNILIPSYFSTTYVDIATWIC